MAYFNGPGRNPRITACMYLMYFPNEIHIQLFSILHTLIYIYIYIYIYKYIITPIHLCRVNRIT